VEFDHPLIFPLFKALNKTLRFAGLKTPEKVMVEPTLESPTHSRGVPDQWFDSNLDHGKTEGAPQKVVHFIS
jgi:hypothetical protein